MKKSESFFEQLEFGDLGISIHPAECFACWRFKERLHSLLPDPSNSLGILDVGCNIGRDLFALPNGRKMFRVGLDQAFNLVYLASRLAQTRGDEIYFCCGNGEDLPFCSETFDMVWCSEVIEHFNNSRHALQEFWRILKPHGGIVLISTPNPRCITSIIASVMPVKIKAALYHSVCVIK